MALAPLATVEDLQARGIDTSDVALTGALLASASETIREAAGATILLHTGTVTIPGSDELWLDVPGWAIRSVTAVTIDDTTVDDWKLVGHQLWRAGGWHGSCSPSLVTMTVTQGLDETPADIVDLCCSLVAGGVAAAANDAGAYNPQRGISYERIDDYQYGKTQGADEIVSPMILPDRTRQWLRARFGGSVDVVGSYG